MRFSAKKNAGCPKSRHDFPPRKDGILLPASGCLGTFPPPSPESVRTDVRSYADVTTKISHIDKLPDFLTHGAPLARFARWSSAIGVLYPTLSFTLLSPVNEFILSIYFSRISSSLLSTLFSVSYWLSCLLLTLYTNSLCFSISFALISLCVHIYHFI